VGRQVWPFAVVTGATGVLVGTGEPPVPAIGWPPAHGTTAALLGALLLTLAYGLRRRRLVAYCGTLAVAVGGAVWAGPSPLALGLLAVAAVLVPWRRAFLAVPGHGQIRLAVRCAVLVLAAGALYDAALRHHDVLRMAWPHLLLLTAIVALVAAQGSAPAPAPADDEDRARVGELVDHPGSDTLAPFALRRDKTYVFSADRRAAIGYRVLLGVAVAGADPVGDPDSYADAVDRFVDECARHGWRTAVLGARHDLQRLWRRHRMHGIGIGDEVVLDVAGFGLSTRRMRNVRQAVRRTHNAGATTEVVREGDVDPRLRDELVAVSAQWLDGARERGFSMNLDGFLRGVYPECVLVVARDAAGRVAGYQRYAPCRGGAALSLDTMRRVRTGPNGLNERMVVDLVAYARAHGIAEISLNFAAFHDLLAAGRRRGLERVAYRAVHLLDPLVRVESLYLFNAKFRPGYVARGLLFSSWFALPVIAAAVFGMEFALGYDRRRVAERADVPERRLLGDRPLPAS
jgi:lysylphosphatidylglycerol synthetase-like protein (DUF2156 family)